MATSRRGMLATIGAFAFAACAPLSGCVAQTTTAAQAAAEPGAQFGDLVGRVIMKFKDANAPVKSAQMLADLQRTSGVRVIHTRALGAGAHLYELIGLRDQAALEQAVKRLGARADMEFAEIDRLMKPAQPKAKKP